MIYSRIFGSLAVLILVFSSAACSIFLTSPYEELLPCDQGQCPEGFSCLVHECVPDSSIPQEGTCNLDQQCMTPMTCAPNLYTCLDTCSDYYRQGAACGAGRYCHPVFDENGGVEGEWVGACVSSSNCWDDGCRRAGDVCVKMGATADACLPGCEISWTGVDGYSDNCGSSILEPKICQPVGLAGDETLICRDTDVDDAASEGEICDPVDNACQRETDSGDLLTCIDGSCHSHCNPDSSSDSQCVGGEVCCPRSLGATSADSSYGYCADSCD